MTTTRNTVERYEWRSLWDDVRERRVSDWDHAEACDRCRARIVHVYVVRRADGVAETLGRECAHLALGWPRADRARLETLARAAVARAAEEKRQGDWWHGEATARALGTAGEARAACVDRNRGDAAARPIVAADCVVFTVAGRWYAVPAACTDQARYLVARGWRRVEARDLGTCAWCEAETEVFACVACDALACARHVDETRDGDPLCGRCVDADRARTDGDDHDAALDRRRDARLDSVNA